uniref:Uncharacterized protein n=1 Tax=Eutreptiella gymnastica TaxID=73025 RepID=A0A6U7VEJ1_9EUGL|mmetsp:Transcript_129448/g.223663  ORF Transcript_129448/g.223663 Transcript_129448/m.223663 type:complete len:117 (+) Transcript_129448:530-880(+)
MASTLDSNCSSWDFARWFAQVSARLHPSLSVLISQPPTCPLLTHTNASTTDAVKLIPRCMQLCIDAGQTSCHKGIQGTTIWHVVLSSCAIMQTHSPTCFGGAADNHITSQRSLSPV